MSSKIHKRSLLKFSLYSTAVVLPKKLLAELGWEAGDEVRIITDSKGKQLIIEQPQPITFIDRPTIERMVEVIPEAFPETMPTRLFSENVGDSILPIPEIE